MKVTFDADGLRLHVRLPSGARETIPIGPGDLLSFVSDAQGVLQRLNSPGFRQRLFREVLIVLQGKIGGTAPPRGQKEIDDESK